MPKRIERDLPSSFPSVLLFRDDLESIVQAIQRCTREPPTICDDEYEYDSLEELAANRGSVAKHVHIFSHRSSCWVDVRLESDSARLYVDSHSVEAKQAYQSIAEILRGRRRWFCFLSELPEGPSWLSTAGIAVAVCSLALPAPVNRALLGCGVLLVAYGCLNLIGDLVTGGWRSKVYLCKRHELAPTPFRKLWKTIGIPFLLMVIGGVVTKGCDYAWDKVTSEPPEQRGSGGEN